MRQRTRLREGKEKLTRGCAVGCHVMTGVYMRLSMTPVTMWLFRRTLSGKHHGVSLLSALRLIYLSPLQVSGQCQRHSFFQEIEFSPFGHDTNRQYLHLSCLYYPANLVVAPEGGHSKKETQSRHAILISHWSYGYYCSLFIFCKCKKSSLYTNTLYFFAKSEKLPVQIFCTKNTRRINSPSFSLG